MFADLARETSTTTGTGAFTLAGAVVGHPDFLTARGNGKAIEYRARNNDDPGQWEVGVGILTAGPPTTLSRLSVLSSSNAGGVVNFGPGTKDIICSVSGSSLLSRVLPKSTAYSVTPADFNALIDATGTWALSLPAAAVLGNGWYTQIKNSGTGVITLDPNGSETVDGAATLALGAGESALLVCTGSGWTALRMGVVQAAAANTATVTLADNVTVGDFVAALNNGSVEKVKQNIALTPSVGAEYTFNTNQGIGSSVAYSVASDKIVIAYRNDGDSTGYGIAVVATVSGSTISFGTPVVYHSASTGVIQSVVWDATNDKFVFFYQRSSDGYVMSRVGSVSGTTISFGTETTVRGVSSGFAVRAAYDSTNSKVVVLTQDNSTSAMNAFVGTVSGTTISFGTAVSIASGAAVNLLSGGVTFNASSGKVVCVYRLSGDGNLYGAVGTVSGTTISFGTSVNISSGSVASSYGASICSVMGSSNVIVSYVDASNNNYGTSKFCNIIGTSITANTACIFNSAATSHLGCAYDGSNDVLSISFCSGDAAGRTITAVISGNTLTFSTAVTYNSGNTRYQAMAYNSVAAKMIVTYADESAALSGTAVAVSTSSITSNSPDVIGVATETRASGQTCAIIPMGAVDTTTGGLSVGQDYYITGAGVRTTTAGANVYVGRAVASNQLLLRGIAKR